MRAVIDTNVFVGACIGWGASSRVIEACITGDIVPVMGEALFLEYEDVSARRALFDLARLDDEARQALFEIFLSKCIYVDIYFLWRPNLRDESDNHLMELALADRADLIVRNNIRDFRNPDLKFDQIRILSPQQAVEELLT